MQDTEEVVIDKLKFSEIMKNHAFINGFTDIDILGSDLITKYKDINPSFDAVKYSVFVAAFIASTNYDIEAYAGKYVDAKDAAKQAHNFLINNISVKEVLRPLEEIKVPFRALSLNVRNTLSKCQSLLGKTRHTIQPISGLPLCDYDIDNTIERLMSDKINVNLGDIAIFHNLYILSYLILEFSMHNRDEESLIKKAQLSITDIEKLQYAQEVVERSKTSYIVKKGLMK